MIRSRRWCCVEDTRFVAARLAIYSTSVLYLRSLRRRSLRPNPKGCAVCVRDAATHKSALSREYRDGHGTTSKRGGKGDSPSSGAAGLHHTARFASVARPRQLRGSSGNRRRRQAIHSCPCM